jgi:glycogen synthase
VTLRLLLVIAQYPPHHLGGYELRCRDTARALAGRGHSVTVLTSTVGASGVEDDKGVRVVRGLHLDRHGIAGRLGVWRFIQSTSADCALFRDHVRSADVVHYWHMMGLTSALLGLPRPPGCGVLCDVSSIWLEDVGGTGGNWFRIWESRAGAGWKRLAKALVRPLVGAAFAVPTVRPRLPPGRCYFTSEAMLDRARALGIPLDDAVVIDSGVDLGTFVHVAERDHDGPLTLLFLSRIKRWKGLHTVLRALAELPDRYRLRVLGAIDDPAYQTEIDGLVGSLGLADRVSLEDPIPHDGIPEVLASGHVLVFASEQPEPFSRMVLEAFAVGTPVAGTTIGGTGKVLRDGQTGVEFEPGDASGLAAAVLRLEDRELRSRVIENGLSLVRERYSLDATVDQIEGLLREARSSSAPPPAR